MTPIQISTMFSIGSLVLGFSAWIFGIFAIRTQTPRSYANTVCSFSLCVMSVILQLFEVQNRVNIGDYAAIEDTIGAINFAAIALAFITIVLNLIAFLKARKK